MVCYASVNEKYITVIIFSMLHSFKKILPVTTVTLNPKTNIPISRSIV